MRGRRASHRQGEALDTGGKIRGSEGVIRATFAEKVVSLDSRWRRTAGAKVTSVDPGAE